MKAQSWKSLGKAGQGKWSCVSCRSKERTSSQTQEDEILSHEVTTKIDSLLALIPAVNQIKDTLEFLSGRYDDILSEIKLLRQENKDLKVELKEVKAKQQVSDATVKDLLSRVNEMEQYGRRVNLEIHGVPVRGPKVEEEDTYEVVKELGKTINVPFVPEEIHRLHRLQKRKDGNPPAIMVQFFSSQVRDKWLQAGKKSRLSDRDTGKQVFFNENLSLYYKNLLRDTKARAKIYNYKYVWFKNGKVFVKRGEGSENVIVIRSLDDIKKIGV
ncbi:uncharacterized protein LOC124373396 [Homalodisca vitripennis]|uniref:uncharacterized protein LOC124373396 n=1 Tax=Homalodisca vitripennis TaxID=197043 RepID=UPI001EEB24C5|nr:uncharacterized protein LOC124373396 [Homalodisca vitripennis]